MLLASYLCFVIWWCLYCLSYTLCCQTKCACLLARCSVKPLALSYSTRLLIFCLSLHPHLVPSFLNHIAQSRHYSLRLQPNQRLCSWLNVAPDHHRRKLWTLGSLQRQPCWPQQHVLRVQGPCPLRQALAAVVVVAVEEAALATLALEVLWPTMQQLLNRIPLLQPRRLRGTNMRSECVPLTSNSLHPHRSLHPPTTISPTQQELNLPLARLPMPATPTCNTLPVPTRNNPLPTSTPLSSMLSLHTHPLLSRLILFTKLPSIPHNISSHPNRRFDTTKPHLRHPDRLPRPRPSMQTLTSTVHLLDLPPIHPIRSHKRFPALPSRVALSCTKASGISSRSSTTRARAPRPTVSRLRLPLNVLPLLESSVPPSARRPALSAKTRRTTFRPVPSMILLLSFLPMPRRALLALLSKTPRPPLYLAPTLVHCSRLL